MTRILICEESFLERSLLHRLLAPLGDCELATCGEEAEDACRAARTVKSPFDLITVDVTILANDPGLSVRLQEKQGQDAHTIEVQKPVDSTQVSSAIRNLLD